MFKDLRYHLKKGQQDNHINRDKEKIQHIQEELDMMLHQEEVWLEQRNKAHRLKKTTKH